MIVLIHLIFTTKSNSFTFFHFFYHFKFVRNIGLVAYDKTGKLHQLSNVSIKAWADIKDTSLELVG